MLIDIIFPCHFFSQERIPSMGSSRSDSVSFGKDFSLIDQEEKALAKTPVLIPSGEHGRSSINGLLSEVNPYLKTSNFRLIQTERVCRRQF